MSDYRQPYPNELYHYGILGMKWGIRRYQNPDGTLTPAGQKHYAKADLRWAKKNNDKIVKKTQKKVSGELRAYYTKELSRQPGFRTSRGKVSKSAINAYNSRMSQLMNAVVGDIRSPSGKVVQFVAKRGDVGVYMALADPGYDMSQLDRGVWSTGRIAYKKRELSRLNIND